jgi:L-asparaginase
MPDWIATSGRRRSSSPTLERRLTLKQWLDLPSHQHVFKEEPDLPAWSSPAAPIPPRRGFTLDLTVRSEKPVVVVGSMRNRARWGMRARRTCSKDLRGASPTRGGRVPVVLNVRSTPPVTSPRPTHSASALSSHEDTPGVVDSDRVVFIAACEAHTARASSTSAGSTSCRASMWSWFIKALGRHRPSWIKARGIVIASAGAGATSGTQGQGIQHAIDKGVRCDEHTDGSGRTQREAAEPPRPQHQTTATLP